MYSLFSEIFHNALMFSILDQCLTRLYTFLEFKIRSSRAEIFMQRDKTRVPYAQHMHSLVTVVKLV